MNGNYSALYLLLCALRIDAVIVNDENLHFILLMMVLMMPKNKLIHIHLTELVICIGRIITIRKFHLLAVHLICDVDYPVRL